MAVARFIPLTARLPGDVAEEKMERPRIGRATAWIAGPFAGQTDMPGKPAPNDEAFRMYYQHQYERMKELEQQRLAMTNVVVGLSVLVFSLAFKDVNQLNYMNALALPFVVLVLNAIAIAWNSRSRAFIKMHQKRAHKALELYAPELEALDQSIPKPFDSQWDYLRRPSLQNYLHCVLMFVALFPLCAYVFKLAMVLNKG